MLRVVVRGSKPVEIRTAPVLIISFELPAMTEAEFFGDSLIQNLATFLKVPPNMIRITNIIREDGGSRRRRRSTGLKVEVEIKKPLVHQTSNTTNGWWEKNSGLRVDMMQCSRVLFTSLCSLGSPQMMRTSHC